MFKQKILHVFIVFLLLFNSMNSAIASLYINILPVNTVSNNNINLATDRSSPTYVLDSGIEVGFKDIAVMEKHHYGMATAILDGGCHESLKMMQLKNIDDAGLGDCMDYCKCCFGTIPSQITLGNPCFGTSVHGEYTVSFTNQLVFNLYRPPIAFQ